MASAAPTLGSGGVVVVEGGAAGAGHAAPTATHILASSIAVPSKASLSKLQSRLTETAMQISPLTQRDVFCLRSDEIDGSRGLAEQDARFGPVRKARLQSRLSLRFENNAIDMRLLVKPAGKGPDFTDVYNMTVVPLYAREVQGPSKKQVSDFKANKFPLPDKIDVGANFWQQVVQSIGWTPRRNLVRIGTRFVLRSDPGCRVEAMLFQMYSVDPDQSVVERISETNVLQVTATLPLVVRGRANEERYRDASQLYKQAQSEIGAVQDILQGIVQLRKEEE